MKHFILFLVLSASALAQDTCFTKKQINDIATGVKTMEWRLTYSDSLAAEQARQIAVQELLLRLRDTTISGLKTEVKLQRISIGLHDQAMTKMEKALVASQKSSFFDKLLYALAGVGAGYLLFH